MWLSLAAVALSQNIALGAEREPTGESSLALSYWRIGMTFDAKLGARMPLFEKDGNALFQDTGIKAMA